MSRTVFCAYYKEELPGLPAQFYPGAIGERIFNEISMQAWRQWLSKQTMLVNEHKYNLLNPEHKKILEETMVAFLFEGAQVHIAGYVAPQEKATPATTADNQQTSSKAPTIKAKEL